MNSGGRQWRKISINFILKGGNNCFTESLCAADMCALPPTVAQVLRLTVSFP